MRNWLFRLFGFEDAVQAPTHPLVADAEPAPGHASDGRSRDKGPAGALLTSAQVDFLCGLIDPLAVCDLGDLPPDDRAFVAGIQKRLRNRDLELPILPEVAVRLSRMIRDGVPLADYVALLNQDPSLSVEVLKTANSAHYGASTQITTLQEAVVRIGITRLQSILMLAHLKARVMKAGSFQPQAEVLLDMALPLGTLASRFAREHSKEPDMCFTRGVLMHVEHLVIISAINSVSRDFRRSLSPSVHALHQAFVRFGGDIRRAVATQWKLTDLLVGAAGSRTSEDYDLLRRVLVCRWLGRPTPPPAVAWNHRDPAIADLRPRVDPRAAGDLGALVVGDSGVAPGGAPLHLDDEPGP